MRRLLWRVAAVVLATAIAIGASPTTWAAGDKPVAHQTAVPAALLELARPAAEPSGQIEGRTLAATAKECCKHCSKGKPCGNSCIARNKTCRQPPGCAC
ncbi:MAG TPA: hypothetical protein VF175_18000 [Lacipirellula sp.]